LLSDIITVDLVEHSTLVDVEERNYHICEVGGRRPPASHATLTTDGGYQLMLNYGEYFQLETVVHSV